MWRRYFPIVIIPIMLIILAYIDWKYFGITNHDQIILIVLLASHAFLGLVLGIRLVQAGILSGSIKDYRKDHIVEWQKQDAKLAAEVKSDREKQLEAKIVTLETALKQALKKN